MPYARNTIKVKVPNRSGFDKTHRNSGTLKCGTITPILFDEVIPSTRVSLRLPITVQLPPLASDTYMNLKLKVEAFFVPMRLLCKSFEDFFADNAPYEVAGGSTVYNDLIPRIPYFVTTAGYISTGPGTLADYLGIRSFDAQVGRISALPFAAYHLVYQEWYRNPRVQKSPFVNTFFANSYPRHKVMCMLDTYFCDSPSAAATVQAEMSPAISLTAASDANLNDGVSIFALRQRNFGQDYFTGARLTAQQGPAVTVDTAVVPDPVTAGDQTRMTISALRAANSLQMFKERNMLPSSRYVDQVKARYGASLSDGVAQRPICIGTGSYDVASTGISQTSANSGTGAVGQNPFDSVAAQYGRAYASGSDFIIKDFTANEPGYILVNATLVPEVTYYTGLDRMFLRYTAPGSITDMANNLLQNVGDQPIFQWELAGNSGSYYNHIVGYQDRFADFMYKPNSVHGAISKAFNPGSVGISSFVLQRGFSGASPLDLSSALLEIPTNYLDDVFAVTSGTAGFSAWYDAMLQYKVSMPLAEFSIPSLQDPAYEHGQTISLRRNGQIF